VNVSEKACRLVDFDSELRSKYLSSSSEDCREYRFIGGSEYVPTPFADHVRAKPIFGGERLVETHDRLTIARYDGAERSLAQRRKRGQVDKYGQFFVKSAAIADQRSEFFFDRHPVRMAN